VIDLRTLHRQLDAEGCTKVFHKQIDVKVELLAGSLYSVMPRPAKVAVGLRVSGL